MSDVSSPLPSNEAKADPSSHVFWARKAARGAAALALRQVLTYGANVIGGIFLARLLAPADFGFYAIAALFLAFLSIFGGTGFAGNLIRTLDDPGALSYRAAFTAQQIIVAVLFVLIWIAAPQIAALYHLHAHGVWFFRCAGISLFLTSLMVIPQVVMERHLAFDKLALVEVAQAIAFNAVAIVFAWRGYGVLAFAAGLVARSAVGAIMANLISPWSPGFHFHFSEIRSHASFGVLLQGSQLAAMVKDSITPLFIGLFLGSTSMGYATWAMTFAGYPTLLLMPMQRLYMPFFAKLQNDRAALSRFALRALWIVNVIAAPLAVLSVTLARPITVLIFGQKWLVALPLFYCFSVVNLSGPANTPLMGLLNAIGKPHLTLWVVCLAMIAIWALGVPLVIVFGILGFGIAVALASLVNVVLYWFVWKETAVWPWRSYWPSWPLAIVVGLAVFGVQKEFPVRTLPVLLAYSAVALLVYLGVLWFGFNQQSAAWVRVLRSAE